MESHGVKRVDNFPLLVRIVVSQELPIHFGVPFYWDTDDFWIFDNLRRTDRRRRNNVSSFLKWEIYIRRVEWRKRGLILLRIGYRYRPSFRKPMFITFWVKSQNSFISRVKECTLRPTPKTTVTESSRCPVPTTETLRTVERGYPVLTLP